MISVLLSCNMCEQDMLALFCVHSMVVNILWLKWLIYVLCYMLQWLMWILLCLVSVFSPNVVINAYKIF
jgi:hypothetical protein